MLEQIKRLFAAIADGVGRGIADIRNKLIEEGVWGRHVAEPSARDRLQDFWGKNVEASHEPGLLDRLFAADPKHHPPTQDAHSRDHDRGPDLER